MAVIAAWVGVVFTLKRAGVDSSAARVIYVLAALLIAVQLYELLRRLLLKRARRAEQAAAQRVLRAITAIRSLDYEPSDARPPWWRDAS